MVLRSAITRWSDESASLLSLVAGGAGEGCLGRLLLPWPRFPCAVDGPFLCPPPCCPPPRPVCDLPRCLPSPLLLFLRALADSEPESAAPCALLGFLLVERLLDRDDGRGLPAPALMEVEREAGPFFLGACLLAPCGAEPLEGCCFLSSFFGSDCCDWGVISSVMSFVT